MSIVQRKRSNSAAAVRAAKIARLADMLAVSGSIPRVPRQRLVRRTPQYIGAEVNYVDLASATYAFDTTGSITLLATVAQGTSVNTRIGKKCMWKSIQMRGFANSGTTATYNDCAILLVYDKRPQGALPAITAILDTANARSMNNDANSPRFTILRRWDFPLVSNAGTPLGEESFRSVDSFVRVNKPVEFAAAGTGAIGDIVVGALYLVTVGSNPAGTAAASLTAGFRTRFVDM